MGCHYLSTPLIPASGTQVQNCSEDTYKDTVRCLYNMANILQNACNRHPIYGMSFVEYIMASPHWKTSFSEPQWAHYLMITSLLRQNDAMKLLMWQLRDVSIFSVRDGTLGVVGTRDGWVLFFDMTTLAMKKYERVAMRKPVNLMLTSKSGRFIITAATTIRVWSPQGKYFCKGNI